MRFEIMDNDLLSVQEARILAENARDAQAQMAAFSQSRLDTIVAQLADAVRPHVKELALMSADETDYGNWQDKLVKNRFVTETLPRQLASMKCVGITHRDEERKLYDIGVPLGVLVSLTPATSPVSTTIYNALIAIKSGNAILFSPHPRAERTSARVLDILIQAAASAGLPEGALAYLHTVTKAGTRELMNHPATAHVMITGVPGMVDEAQRSGKPVIVGGIGGGPAFIEKTADLEQAVCDIIASKTFDNGVASAAEQQVVVDAPVEAQVRALFARHGAYFMSDEEAQRLGEIFFFKDGSANPEPIGKTALELARWAKIDVPLDTKVLIAQQKSVAMTNPYSKEKLCPVLSYYVEDDWLGACEKCIELLLTERKGHTLVIHSRDENVIEQFALKKPVARILVNTPAAYGGMGMTTNLFPAMTLGSGTIGQGITTDNVSPLNLVYVRKVGVGVRRVEDLGFGAASCVEKKQDKPPALSQAQLEQLQIMLEQALQRSR